MSRALVKLIAIALLLGAALALFIPLCTFLAVDSCLDASRTYDYEIGECDFRSSHSYLPPAVPNYLMLAGGAVLAPIGGFSWYSLAASEAIPKRALATRSSGRAIDKVPRSYTGARAAQLKRQA